VPEHNHTPVWPFDAHDYEIIFAPCGTPREAHILAKEARPLEVGHLYTLDRAGCLYDLIVEAIERQTDGHWNARCAVADLQWI
jgi:hypothetical protein